MLWTMVNQIYDTSGLQAEMMSRFSGITLSPLQKERYRQLREPLNGQSDQQILAESLRQTDSAELTAFMMAYKHIFVTELSVIDANEIAQFAKILLTEAEIALYIQLRALHTEASNQKILAEALKKSGSSNLHKFMMAYKRLFLAELTLERISQGIPVT